MMLPLSHHTNKQTIQNILKSLSTLAKYFGKQMSTGKSKELVLSKSGDNAKGKGLKVQGEELELVGEFKYLGAMINSTNDTSVEIMRRTQLAREGLSNLKHIFLSQSSEKSIKHLLTQ
jgi:hypothetical protein